MTSIVRADNISTVAGTGTVTLEAGNTLDTSAGLVTPAGHVIQVVQGNHRQTTTNTTNNYVDTGLSVSITPKFSTSQIYIMCAFQVELVQSGSSTRFTLDINGSTPDEPLLIHSWPQGDAVSDSFQYLYSPASTSTQTMKLIFKNENSGYSTTYGSLSGSTYALNTITAMEIAG
jgi:hypothetical protein